MGELVANLLQFSRRGAEQISTVDIREELAKAVELIDHHLRKRQITVVARFAADTPLIYADRQKLRQVFLNLLTNASDAMPQGGTLTLRTSSATLEDGQPAVLIEFVDTGVGIPPEHLEKIMEPFFTTKEEGKGTGLGPGDLPPSRSRRTRRHPDRQRSRQGNHRAHRAAGQERRQCRPHPQRRFGPNEPGVIAAKKRESLHDGRQRKRGRLLIVDDEVELKLRPVRNAGRRGL